MLTVKRLLLSLLLSLLLTGCASHIFYPAERQWQITPSDLGYSFHNHDLLAADGVTINTWQLFTPLPRQGAILYFHGNTQNISMHISQIAWLVDAGFDVVMVDYRGFGASGGEISLDNTVSDMQLVMAWFIERYQQEPRWLLGQSLGAALSIHVAGSTEAYQQAFEGFIFDSAFASFQSIGQDVFARFWLTWPLQYPLSWLMPKGYNAEKAIAALAPTPIVLLHSENDTVVPYKHATRLFDHALPPKQLITYQERHIQGLSNQAVREQILAFLHSNNSLSQ